MAVLNRIGKKALCHELNEHKFFITFDASAQKNVQKGKFSFQTHLSRKRKLFFSLFG